MNGAVIIETLIGVFPPRIVKGQVAPHDCPECRELRGQLTGVTWTDISNEFMRDHPDVLPLLTQEAYLAFLPAWLRQGILDPGSEVAAILLVNLECHPNTAGFTGEQRKAIIEVARFIVRNNGWGPGDPVNVESVLAIERSWSDIAIS